jgi:hypothetical protein
MHLRQTEFQQYIERDGFAVVPSGLPEQELAQLTADLVTLAAEHDLGARGGLRDAFRLLPAARQLATSGPLWHLASTVLGSECAAVRAIVFDKTPGANWKVSWHQDLTIAVRHQIEVPGFGPWSTKAGVLHVQPPASSISNTPALSSPAASSGTRRGGRRTSMPVPLSDADVREAARWAPLETRLDRQLHGPVFQQRHGRWFQCKSWVSRQLFV